MILRKIKGIGGKIRTKAALEEEVATEEATDDNGVITF